jgi:hypothetical protein
MTTSQQKMLLIFPVIVISSYVVHYFATDAMQLSFSMPRMHPKPKPVPVPSPRIIPKVVAAPPAAPIPTNVASLLDIVPDAPPELARLVGIWQGRTAIQGRGVCVMRFELRPKDETKFSGFSSLTCISNGPLVAKPNLATVTLNQTDPEAAIMTGSIDHGSIKFHVDTVAGVDSSGCTPTSFTLMPFGLMRAAAEWKEASCAGGHIILGKTAR